MVTFENFTGAGASAASESSRSAVDHGRHVSGPSNCALTVASYTTKQYYKTYKHNHIAEENMWSHL